MAFCQSFGNNWALCSPNEDRQIDLDRGVDAREQILIKCSFKLVNNLFESKKDKHLPNPCINTCCTMALETQPGAPGGDATFII